MQMLHVYFCMVFPQRLIIHNSLLFALSLGYNNMSINSENDINYKLCNFLLCVEFMNDPMY